MLNGRLSQVCAVLVLISVSATGWANPHSAPAAPTLGGAPDNDLTCEPVPDAAPGHFVCEDRDSYERCKALEGTGAVLVDGAKKATPVIACQQGG